MQNEANIRQSVIDYILLHDPSYSRAKLVKLPLLELITIKTEYELKQLKKTLH